MHDLFPLLRRKLRTMVLRQTQRCQVLVLVGVDLFNGLSISESLKSMS